MKKFDFDNLILTINKNNLLIVNPELGSFFNSAMRSVIKETQEEISRNEINCEDLEKKYEQLSGSYQENGIPSEEYADSCADVHNCLMQTDYLQEILCSIFEMKVVNLYKSLEIATQNILGEAYADIDKKSFFRWDFLISFLKTKDILLRELTGFSEADQLRLVNNKIKHGGTLNEEIKKIIEFNGADSFRFDSLDDFFQRVEQPVNDYLVALSRKVYENKYEYDEKRLEKIAADYKKIMDKDTIEMLIKKLKQA